MNRIIFEWDDEKNKINKKKYGLSFEEAREVFYDDNAILLDDPDHSIGEERFLIIGFTYMNKVCTVSHCYRFFSNNQEIIRIISAREETHRERKYYEQENY